MALLQKLIERLLIGISILKQSIELYTLRMFRNEEHIRWVDYIEKLMNESSTSIII